MTKLLCFLFSVPFLFNAQIYPAEFLRNGCAYAYNGFLSPDTVVCGESQYTLVFEDDFNSDGVNTDKWRTSYPWGRALHSNRYGTDWDQSWMLDENLSVENGLLRILIREDSAIHPAPDNPNEMVPFNYSAGMLFSHENFGHGKYEIRCKIPPITGLWPAFWMFGFCSQELDVFEFTNASETSDQNMDSGNMIMTYHRQYDCTDTAHGKCQNGLTRKTGLDLSLDFHTYALEWTDFKIVWRLDGRVVREVYRLWDVSPSYPLGPLYGYAVPVKDCNDIRPSRRYTEFAAFPTDLHPVHVIVGSSVLLEKNVTVPQEFLVDYIRVYEEKFTKPIKDPGTAKDFLVFPNPASGSFKVPRRIMNQDVSSIEILNSFWLSVAVGVTEEGAYFRFGTETLPAGLYFVRVEVNDQVLVRKLILY